MVAVHNITCICDSANIFVDVFASYIDRKILQKHTISWYRNIYEYSYAPLNKATIIRYEVNLATSQSPLPVW